MSYPKVASEFMKKKHLRSMNLNHRLAQGWAINTLSIVMHRIQGRPRYLIPFILVFLGLWSVKDYIGEVGQTGTLSLVLIPFIGEWLARTIIHEGRFLSTLAILSYVGTSVTTYVYTYWLTKRHLAAFIAGLLFLLPLNPLSVSPDEHLMLGFAQQDGAHIIGFTLIPLVLILYLTFLRTETSRSRITFIILSLLVGLISFFSFTMLFIFTLFGMVSEMLVGAGRVKLRRSLVFFWVVAGIIAVYNRALPPIIISEQGRIAVSVVVNVFPMLFFLVPVCGTILFLIFDRRASLQPLFLAIVSTLTFAVLHFVRTHIVDVFIDQERFAVELSFSTAFLTGIIVTIIFDLLRSGFGLSRYPFLYAYRTRIAFGSMFVVIGVLIASLLLINRSL